MARSVGEVYVTVLANTRVFEDQVIRAARDAGEDAGDEAGKSFNERFSTRVKRLGDDRGMREAFRKIGFTASEQLASGMSMDKVTEQVKVALEDVAREYGKSDVQVQKKFLASWKGTHDEWLEGAKRSIRMREQEKERALRAEEAAERKALAASVKAEEAAAKAREKAIAAAAKERDRSLAASMRRTSSMMKKAGERSGRSYASGFGGVVTRRMKLIAYGIVTLLEPAVAALAGLGGAAVGLAGSLAQAAGSVGALAPVMAGLGVAGGVLVAAFAGLTKEGAKLGPQARELVSAWGRMKDALKDVQSVLRENLFAGVGDSLDRITQVALPGITAGLAGVAAVMNGVMLAAMDRIAAFDWQGLLAGLEPEVRDVGMAFVDLGESALLFIQAASAQGDRLAASLRESAAAMRDWLASAEGQQRINDIIARGLDTVRLWWETIKPFGQGLGDIFSIGATAANDFIAKNKEVGESFHAWTQSLSGQESIAGFFDKAFRALEALGPAIKGLAGGLNNIFTDKAISNLESLSRGLEKALPVVGDFFAVLGETGILDTVGQLLGMIADQLAPLVPTFKDVAAVIANTLAGALDIIGPLLEDLGGAIAETLPLAAPHLEKLSELFLALLELIAPLLPILIEAVGLFAQVGAAISGGLVDALIEVVGFVQQVVDWFTRMDEHVSTVGDAFSTAGQAISGAISGIGEWFSGVGESISTWLSGVGDAVGDWVNGVIVEFQRFASDPLSYIEKMVNGALAWFDDLWRRGVEAVGNLAQGVVTAVMALPGQVRTWIGNTVGNAVAAFTDWRLQMRQRAMEMVAGVMESVQQLPGRVFTSLQGMVGRALGAMGMFAGEMGAAAGRAVASVVTWFSGLPGRVGSALSGIGARIASAFDVAARIAGIVNSIVGFFTGLPGRIVAALGNIGSRILASITSGLPAAVRNLLPFATGGIVVGPTRALIGEAGPEAVIPLTRPLGQVDPSVREMAALLRGERSQAEQGPRKQVNVSMTVQPLSADPSLVAAAVVDRLAVLV